MEEQFITYGSAKVMVANITYDEAQDIADDIEARDDVIMLDFDRTENYVYNFSALYSITFKY